MSRIRIPFDRSVLLLPETEDDVTCMTCGREWTCVRPLDSDYRRATCPNCKEKNVELSRDAPCVVRRLH